MKKVLLLLVCMMPLLGYAQSNGNGGGSGPNGSVDPKDIPLEPLNPVDDHRHDAPVAPDFNAEILPDKTVLVMSRDIATFSVLVFNNTNLSSQYSGQTTSGRLHFTTPLPYGVYDIRVLCEGFTFTGSFTIAEE